MFDNLFQFIMQNLFFFLLIVGGIISILQRARGEEEEKKKQQQRQRQRQQGRPQGEQKVDWEEIFRQEGRQGPQKPQPVQAERIPSQVNKATPIDERRNEIYEKIEQARKQREKAEKRINRTNDSPIFDGDITKEKAKLDLDFKNVSAEEAMKGVIWSEILSKPKARRQQLNTNQYYSRKKG